MTKEDKVNNINSIIREYFSDCIIHETSYAFINDYDGKINVDLCFHNYIDQFSICEEILNKIEKAGIDIEEIGTGTGEGSYICCYSEK